MKKKFLTCLDYDGGGIWRVVMSESKEKIKSLYPELIVASYRPSWMKRAELDSLNESAIDIDDSDDIFFKAVKAERDDRKN